MIVDVFTLFRGLNNVLLLSVTFECEEELSVKLDDVVLFTKYP